MNQPIFKVWFAKPKDAWYKLSEGEREILFKKSEDGRKKLGGEEIITCSSAWCSENWVGWGVEKFPDIEAVQKYTQLLFELDWFNYMESTSCLGTKDSAE